MINKRELGARYEIRTADYLQHQGYTILERNFHCHLGEIDLIARRGRTIAFVEVKYRAGRDYGFPEEAVDFRKQRRIMRVAQYYILTHPWASELDGRYDVAAYQADDSLVYYEGAFGGM